MSNDNSAKALADLVESFNGRRYDDAEAVASVQLGEAVGKDELFWMGLRESCAGFSLVMSDDFKKADPLLVAAMEKLRNFGYRHQNLEVTSVLAGLRRGVEEIRMVQAGEKKMFDVSLLPKIKMSAKADAR
jgi:hypothetical protein